ncbi:MAG TPA: FHA domain-containing protein [Polyangiaceae bacterium]|nr:FHA domain-containing protein [Polyangiaceae bacterium]
MTAAEGTTQLRLRLRDREIWLGPGRYVIGRATGCHVVVEDGRASRRHAELVVRPGSASIRDLDSANGVYVDGVRVGGQPEPLLPGSRVVIGNESIEIGVGHAPSGREQADTLTGEETVPPRRGPDDEEITVRTLASFRPPPSAEPASPEALTRRADALEMFSRLAMEAIRTGRAADAEQLLGVHLRTVLATAKAGTAPKPETLTRALDLSLALALTGRPVWVDYAVELLDALRVPPPSRDVMDRLERAAKLSDRIDVNAVTRWARTLRGRISTLEVQDLDLLDRIEALVATLLRRS